MKISILIPVYNTEKYIEQSVISAINQTYDDKEIILINDGTTDNSIKKIEHLKNTITILDKKNGGTASALNYGIRNMIGDAFLFLGSDDCIESNYLETLVKNFEKNKDSKNIICSHYTIIDENNNKKGKLKQKYPNLPEKEKNLFYMTYMTAHLGTCIISKDLINRYGYFNEDFNAWDFEFWLRLLVENNFKIKFFENYGYYSRWHMEQNSKKVNKDEISQIIENTISKLSENDRNYYLTNISNSKILNTFKIHKSKVSWNFKTILNSKLNRITRKEKMKS